jgi:hypothetical protein
VKHWLIGEVYIHEEEIREILGIKPERDGSWYMSVTKSMRVKP